MAGFLVLAGGAGAQSPADAELAAAARTLLDDPAPEIRGEAAIVLACLRTADAADAARRVLRDPAEAASTRGVLAVGLLADPTAGNVLDGLLGETPAKATDAGVVASFALGLMSPQLGGGYVVDQLNRIQRSSYRRQHDALIALLLAIGTTDRRDLDTALERIYDDDANRDPEVRGLLCELVLDANLLDAGHRARLLVDGSEPERHALLRWQLGREPDAALLPALLRMQHRDPSARVRAAALAVLTRMRHLPALELAAEALHAPHPEEAAQAVRTLLDLGGGSMARAVESVARRCEVPALKAAMLGEIDRPSTELAEHCLAVAADRSRPLPLRIAAAGCMTASLGERAAPVLRDLFVESSGPDLRRLAVLLQSAARVPPSLSRLHRGGGDEELARDSARLCALFAAGHPQIEAFVAARLRLPELDRQQRAALLRASWLSRHPKLAELPDAALPAALRTLLR